MLGDKNFTPEEHSVLFGLMSRNLIEEFGDEGRAAVKAAVIEYGNERGGRMAKKAAADGESLDVVSYMAYKEWVAPPGVQTSVTVSTSPVFETHCTKCPWCAGWDSQGLMEYGKLYCDDVDVALVEGFNPENRLEIKGTLSHGDEYCHFRWLDLDMTEENAARLGDMREKLGDKYIMPFDFHTAHVYFTTRRIAGEKLGDGGIKKVEKAMDEWTGLYGREKYDAVMAYADTDFKEVSMAK